MEWLGQCPSKVCLVSHYLLINKYNSQNDLVYDVSLVAYRQLNFQRQPSRVVWAVPLKVCLVSHCLLINKYNSPNDLE